MQASKCTHMCVCVCVCVYVCVCVCVCVCVMTKESHTSIGDVVTPNEHIQTLGR